MKQRLGRWLTRGLVILIITGISNIACTKAAHNNIAMTEDATHITPPDTTKNQPPDTVPVTPPSPPADTTRKKYLALGDSYTIGESVAENERFPAQTVSLLLQDSIRLGQPEYIATTGWTTINLQAAINARLPIGPYEAVTLLIGVNDQYQHMDTSGYHQRFSNLLQQAIALAGNRKERVFVLSIPDYSVTPFGGGSTTIRQQIDEFNAINKRITLANNVAYINITDISRLAATDPTLTAGDGLHPSGKQYALWAEELAPVMEKALK